MLNHITMLFCIIMLLCITDYISYGGHHPRGSHLRHLIFREHLPQCVDNISCFYHKVIDFCIAVLCAIYKLLLVQSTFGFTVYNEIETEFPSLLSLAAVLVFGLCYQEGSCCFFCQQHSVISENRDMG